MEFIAPPPGTAHLGESLPVHVQRAQQTPARMPQAQLQRIQPQQAPSRPATRQGPLGAMVANSTDWHSTARARVSWLTTLAGWGMALLVIAAAVCANVATGDGVFAMLVTFGGYTWVPIGFAVLAVGTLLVTAVNTGGLRDFHGVWMTAYAVGFVLALFGSLGLIAALVAGAFLVALGIAFVGLMLFALLESL